jgi:rhodanese-related sulfurtransferase
MFSLFKKTPKNESVSIQKLLENGAMILDVRSEEEFVGGHCKGAVNIPLPVLESKLSSLTKDKTIVTCCLSGGRAGLAKKILESHGHTDVHNGGGWRLVNSFQ